MFRFTLRNVVLALAVVVLTAGCEQSTPSATDSSSSNAPADSSRVAESDDTLQENVNEGEHSVSAVNQSAAPPLNDGTGRARLEFASLTYDFGKMSETETRKGELTFTNTGDAPLVIDEVKPTCGCTVIDLKKTTYAPGESGSIAVTFEPSGPNQPGKPQRKYVHIHSNGAASPDGVTSVAILADVKEFISIDPRFLQLDVVPLGETHHADIRITSGDPNFTIDSVFASNPHVTTEILEPDAGSEDGDVHRIVRVHLDDQTPWGGFLSWLSINVTARTSPDAELKTHLARIRVQGEVFGKIAGDPHTFRFGAAPGEIFERELTLTHRAGEAFDVTDVSVTCSNVTDVRVKSTRLAPDSWLLVLHAEGAGIGAARGTVRVGTSVDGPESTIEIPIVGVVRQPRR